MNIGGASDASGVSQRMIRHYEQIGLVPAPARRDSGYRDYAPDDVARLRFIANARDLGFPIEDIRTLLSLWSVRARASAEVKRLALAALLNLAERCEGDDRPDCPIIDRLAGATGAQGN